MKQYHKAILKQIQRAEQLQSINNIQAARRRAMKGDSIHSKEIYQDTIESNRRLRAEHNKAQKTWK